MQVYTGKIDGSTKGSSKSQSLVIRSSKHVRLANSWDGRTVTMDPGDSESTTTHFPKLEHCQANSTMGMCCLVKGDGGRTSALIFLLVYIMCMTQWLVHVKKKKQIE